MLGVPNESQIGVCARVKLRLEQDAVLSRDAFKASLDIENRDANPLEDLRIDLYFRTAEALDATEWFGVRPPVLDGLSGVDGTGIIPPQSTGKATWTLIPTHEAAPTEPVQYLVGGTLAYTQGGTRVTVPLADVPITVYPQPLLSLQYFHQRDVFSDDPFTDEVEPKVPYSLAVLVRNSGGGAARNFRIESAQPQIVENEKGLLIDFQLIATEVAGQPLVPSLTASFGDIGPGQLKAARWLFTSSLQGLFIDYKATFKHLDALGNDRLSLIDSVSIHEMIRLVEAGGPFADGRPDYLVNDVPDLRDRPDTLYLSDGTTNTVAVVESATADGAPSDSDLEVELTAVMPPGWAYLRVPDPGDGQFPLTRIVRSDGVELPLDRLFWTTDRTFIGLGRRPAYENILHLLDHDSPGRYTLIYGPPPAVDRLPPASAVAALPASGPATIPVRWEGTDDASGIAFFDLFVSVDGGPFTPWLERSALRGALYPGEVGRSYAFYSVATDMAGNREAAPLSPDAQTRVTYLSGAPVLSLPTEVTTDEDVPLENIPFTVTDADTFIPALRFEVLSSDPALLPPGNVTLQAGLGRLSLTPAPDRSGRATLTIRVTDGTSTADALVRVIVRPVNDPPVAADDAITMPSHAARTRIAALDLLRNDRDVDFDELKVTGVPPLSEQGGALLYDADEGWISYARPGPGFGTDRFTYQISDGRGGVGEGTVVVTEVEADGGFGHNIAEVRVAVGVVEIEAYGVPGRTYALEFSETLTPPDWRPTGAVGVADATGRLILRDTPPGDLVERYYRTREVIVPAAPDATLRAPIQLR